jgi:SPX domain protein involved in polyphosphate accumulation
MAIEVFNRYENKYIITDEIYGHLVEYFKEYMQEDGHSQNNGFYNISNVYYDTKDSYLIRRSMDKPIYKEKLRLRSYGKVNLNSKCFLEIKKKYNGVVNKRRTVLTIQEANKFISTKEKPIYKPYMNKQVINEIDYFIHRYEITLCFTYPMIEEQCFRKRIRIFV